MKLCALAGALAIGILLTTSAAQRSKCCCCRHDEGASGGDVESTTNSVSHHDESGLDYRSGHEGGGDRESAGSKGPHTPEMKTVFNLINFYRRKVARGEVENQPPSNKIYDLAWDDELARMAQEYASTCHLYHNPNEERETEKFHSVGQSIGVSTSLEQCVTNWFNEHVNYDYSSNICRDFICGHYAQLVWANTTDVGCGWHKCTYDKALQFYLVCHYAPAADPSRYRPY
ncbi:unnamed protein product [Rodentolepis nana]|uniref:SCP domain-containing protein n=1 Tax=Rodentolepis nana TaxID=102285 RepID=A0A0R3TEY3_RODNA|nr:unnamed protein product [Rodentolepis nana]